MVSSFYDIMNSRTYSMRLPYYISQFGTLSLLVICAFNSLLLHFKIHLNASLCFFYNTLLFIEEIKTKYNHSYLYFYVNISLLGCKLLSSSILFLVTSGICLLVTQELLNDILYCFYAELHSASNNLVTFF